LIEKKSKNSIQWLGAGPGCNTREVTDQLIDLKNELLDLERKEMDLDQHYAWAKQSIHNIMDDPLNRCFSYVKQEDVVGVNTDSTLLVIQAPVGTQLEVPPVPEDKPETTTYIYGSNGQVLQRIVKSNPNKKKKYQMNLKSRSGPINVFLVNPNDEKARPVFQDFPPPEQEDFEVVVQENNGDVKEEEEEEEEEEVPDDVVLEETVCRGRTRSCSDSKNSHDSLPSTRSPRKAAQNHSLIKSKKDCTTTGASTSKRKRPEDGTSEDEGLMDENKATNNRQSFKRVRRMSEVLSLIDVLPDIHQPLVRLTPPPNARDFRFNLDETEGAADLFVD